MNTIGAILLGLVNVAIVVVLLLLVGALAAWIFASILHWAIPGEVRQLYLALVALIALYMVIALIFGLPTLRVLPFR